MKFYVGSKSTGVYFKNEIRKIFAKNGGFISVAEVKELFRETPEEDDTQYGWDDDSDIGKKMRVRECKDGWYLYLPDPNAKICFTNKEKDNSKLVATIEPPDIDVCVFETELFTQLIDELVKLRSSLNGGLANITFVLDKTQFGFYYRDCVVKAKKSGRKEERQDRNAKFHRWADLSKGVQQVVAIVEFDDGHIEQVQPDRVVFVKEVEEND